MLHCKIHRQRQRCVSEPGRPDVSHYMFADGAHPTPFEHFLVAGFIAQRMGDKGWWR